MAKYLSCAETAKLVRAALKKAFPGVKFSVRSHVYSGGASINVGWVDGPKTKAVEAVAGAYSGGGFDGMIDMAYSVDSWLYPDGSVSMASSPGTSGSMGIYSPYDHEAVEPGAERVRFGAKYIFCERENSLEAFTAATKKVCEEWGFETPVIVAGYSPYIKDGWGIKVPNAGQDLATLVHRELAAA